MDESIVGAPHVAPAGPAAPLRSMLWQWGTLPRLWLALFLLKLLGPKLRPLMAIMFAAPVTNIAATEDVRNNTIAGKNSHASH